MGRHMDIYIADLRVFTEERPLTEKSHLLPQERRERIAGYRNQADKDRGIGAGLLLEYGLRRRGYTLLSDVPDKTSVHMVYGKYGKPYLREKPDLQFNLSHAGKYVAAVFSETAVGIDIEYMRTAKLAVAKRFFTADEYAYLQSVLAEHGDGEWLNREFAWLWTRKESYIKAVGDGMHLPLADFEVLADTVHGNVAYFLKSMEMPENYMLSICAKTPIEAEAVSIDLGKAFDAGI